MHDLGTAGIIYHDVHCTCFSPIKNQHNTSTIIFRCVSPSYRLFKHRGECLAKVHKPSMAGGMNLSIKLAARPERLNPHSISIHESRHVFTTHLVSYHPSICPLLTKTHAPDEALGISLTDSPRGTL
jgi:hypothetical protein